MRTALIALLIVVCVGLGLLALWRDHGQDAERLASGEVAGSAVVTAQWGRSAPPEQIVQVIGAKASESLSSGGVSRADAERLAELAAEFLSVYQACDASAFRRLLESQGLSADESAEGTDGLQRFERLTRNFRSAKFFPDEASWSELVVDGQPAGASGPPHSGPSSPLFPGVILKRRSLNLARGEDDVVDAVQSGTTQVRLLLPTVLKDDEGHDAPCRVELVFTRRQSDGEWLLTGTGLSNVPMEHQMVDSPPIR